METRYILWIAHGKKKQVVYDFIEHMGLEWMSHMEAVACDDKSKTQSTVAATSSGVDTDDKAVFEDKRNDYDTDSKM